MSAYIGYTGQETVGVEKKQEQDVVIIYPHEKEQIQQSSVLSPPDPKVNLFSLIYNEFVFVNQAIFYPHVVDVVAFCFNLPFFNSEFSKINSVLYISYLISAFAASLR